MRTPGDAFGDSSAHSLLPRDHLIWASASESPGELAQRMAWTEYSRVAAPAGRRANRAMKKVCATQTSCFMEVCTARRGKTPFYREVSALDLPTRAHVRMPARQGASRSCGRLLEVKDRIHIVRATLAGGWYAPLRLGCRVAARGRCGLQGHVEHG